MRPSFPSNRCISSNRRPKTATIALLLLSTLALTPPRAAAGFVATRSSGRRLASFFPHRRQLQQMASSPSSPSSNSTSSSSSFGDHCSVGSPQTHFCCSAYDERSPAVGSFFALHNAAGDSSSKSSDSPFIPYSTGDDRFPAVPPRQPRSRKRLRTSSSGEGGGGERRRPPPPTHFVAVRVDRPEVRVRFVLWGMGDIQGGKEGSWSEVQTRNHADLLTPLPCPPTHIHMTPPLSSQQIPNTYTWNVAPPPPKHDQQIIAEVERVQAAVVQRHKRLDHIMVPPSKLHVTLGAVLYCHEEGQVCGDVHVCVSVYGWVGGI